MGDLFFGAQENFGIAVCPSRGFSHQATTSSMSVGSSSPVPVLLTRRGTGHMRRRFSAAGQRTSAPTVQFSHGRTSASSSTTGIRLWIVRVSIGLRDDDRARGHQLARASGGRCDRLPLMAGRRLFHFVPELREAAFGGFGLSFHHFKNGVCGRVLQRERHIKFYPGRACDAFLLTRSAGPNFSRPPRSV